MAYRVSTGNYFDRKPKNEGVSQSTVKCMYRAQIAGFWRGVTVLWSKNLMNYSLSISVESMLSDRVSTFKIELKSWHFWGKKGYKRFEADGSKLEVFWDLRSAKFLGSPEPCSDYYVALVSQDEAVLLLGDNPEKAYKKVKVRPPLVESVMIYKKEHVFSKKLFSTRAKLDQRKRAYDITVECSTSGPREPEMWISIDGNVKIHVTNLQWKFRGNQTVMIDKQPIQVFWDVHAWLFCAPASSYSLFIFKPGVQQEEDSDTGNETGDEESNYSGPSKYYSIHSPVKASPFFLFMYAWKIE